MAIAAVLSSSAHQRMDHALQSRTRPAGPATIVNVNRISEGVVDLQWQSRTISCRLADVRHALTMSVMVATEHFRQCWELPLTLVQEFAESVEKGAVTVAC
eukprot:3768696-Pyramimonas_sp.AAC.1